jgi:hypothetical protein
MIRPCQDIGLHRFGTAKNLILWEDRSSLEIIRQLTLYQLIIIRNLIYIFRLYYLLGTGFIFASESVLYLVEMTICPLSCTMSGYLKACIAEPLTAWVAIVFSVWKFL